MYFMRRIATRMQGLVPKPVYPAARWLYHRALYRSWLLVLGAWEWCTRQGRGLPSPSLRYRIQGRPDREFFLRSGRKIWSDIVVALESAGARVQAATTILDFGCGCGRVVRWVPESASSSARIVGSDVDDEAIQWCSAHLKFADFVVNQPWPPLPFEADSFDLIYAVSVFTHLDEEAQCAWIDELARVARPAGWVLVTVLGESQWKTLTPAQQQEIKQKGFLFTRTWMTQGLLPEWYQVAHHSKEYALRQFGRRFEVLRYLPLGLRGHQDVMVLRKRL